MASKGQLQWNKGLTGARGPARQVQRPGGCGNGRCGTRPAPERRAPAGMARIEVPDSREPARIYCRGWCATYGQALAEVRALGGVAR